MGDNGESPRNRMSLGCGGRCTDVCAQDSRAELAPGILRCHDLPWDGVQGQ